MKTSTQRAITKYGHQTCVDAYNLHLKGNGASEISNSFLILKGNTNAGDAAINAGRDMASAEWKKTEKNYSRAVIDFMKHVKF